jgi:prepilin-type N-terminal cleavage/methylation domain-containing protein
MMNNRGVTLIELLVVVAVSGILAVGLGASFLNWQGSYMVESQVKELYDDLMDSRLKAMQRNRMHFAVLAADEYGMYEDSNGNGAFDSGTDDVMQKFTNPKFFRYVSLWTGTITMSTKGLILPTTATLHFYVSSNKAAYDCIEIIETRINMGEWDGANCVEN